MSPSGFFLLSSPHIFQYFSNSYFHIVSVLLFPQASFAVPFSPPLLVQICGLFTYWKGFWLPVFFPLHTSHPLLGFQGYYEACFSLSWGKGTDVLPCCAHTRPSLFGLTPYQVDCEPSGQGPSTNTGADSRMSPAEDRAWIQLSESLPLPPRA